MSSPAPQDAGPERDARIAAAIARWREDLTVLGGPNALLRFQAGESASLTLTNAHPAGVAKVLASRRVLLSEIVRSPEAYAEAVRRVRGIKAAAHRLERERGLRTCYLAIGMATWDLPSATQRPAAPVLLRQVNLRPTDVSESDFYFELEPGARANPVLLDYLRATRGVEVDPLAVVGAARNGSPEGAYDVIRRAGASISGFTVRSSLVVSTFTTAKSCAINDLADPETFRSHPVIAAMAGDEQAREAVAAVAPPRPEDPDLDAERVVLDADSSQHAVVDAVLAGSHLVVQGPPGTGKTQTAANLAAALSAAGRRVLVVAEKRSALEGVRRRLASVKLDELVLDPWDDDALSRVQKTLESIAAEEDSGSNTVPPALLSTRDRLAEHRRRLHDPREPWGVSVDEAQTRISELAALPHPPHSRVRLVGTHLHGIPSERLPQVRETLIRVAEQGAWSTEVRADPWFGARVVGEDQTRRLRELVHRLAHGGLDEYRQRVGDLASEVSLKRPRTILDADEQLSLMGRVFATLEIFRPGIFEAPLDELVGATAKRGTERHMQLSMMERRRLRTQARGLLRPGKPPHDLHGVLVRAAEQKQQWRSRSGPGSLPSAPSGVPDVETEHQKFREDIEWLAARLESTREGGELIHTDLDDLQQRLERLAAADDRLAAVPRTISEMDALRREHLGPLLDDFASHRLPVERVPEELDFVWWSSVLDEIKSKDPDYAAHEGDSLRRVRATYERADRAHVANTARRVAEEVDARTWRAVRDLPEQADALLSAPTGSTAWHQLLAEAPELLTIARPCWVMSPHEVANLVPPGLWFDVVIFDEASQIPAAAAVSAISRAEQVVAFGDTKQLGPTSFAVSGADPQVVAGESLLDALLPLLPQQCLTWHYRSSDERLVSFTNAQMYSGSLVTLPSPVPHSPVRLALVTEGRADGDTIPAEIERVVGLVVEQLHAHPEESIGIVTFSAAHAAAIEAALRQRAGADKALARSLAAEEPLAVWTCDEAQGEERDAVMVSIGAGRDASGAVTHRFGALGDEGGERRLTVAITRARHRLEVVSSVSADELQPAKLRSRGAQMLRDLLVYAAGDETDGGAKERRPGVARVGGRRRRTASSGSVLDRPLQPGSKSRPRSPVVADLAARLRSKGLVVEESVGHSRLPIDLVVADSARPHEPLVAVETDGPPVGHIRGVRDRERLRPERLRELGWAYERVWTVDVFRDPARDVARIQSLVERLSRERGLREHPERVRPSIPQPGES